MDTLYVQPPVMSSMLKSRSSKSSPIVSKSSVAPKTLSAFLVASKSVDFTHEGYFDRFAEMEAAKRANKKLPKIKILFGKHKGSFRSKRLFNLAKSKLKHRQREQSSGNVDKGKNIKFNKIWKFQTLYYIMLYEWVRTKTKVYNF